MKKKNTKNKLKEIKLQMKFNPGKMAFEPVLPENKNLGKKLRNNKIKVDWWILIPFIIFLIIMVYFIIKNI